MSHDSSYLQISGVERRKTEIRNGSIVKIENSTMLKPFKRVWGSFVFRLSEVNCNIPQVKPRIVLDLRF